MGIRARDAYYDTEGEMKADWENIPLEFYNECLFVEHEIMENIGKNSILTPLMTTLINFLQKKNRLRAT